MSRILMVDDDVLISRAVQFWLAERGHVVITAAGAADAIEKLRRDSFDLMLVDIFMPHMDGFESVRQLHDVAPDVPLIALSGYAFAESVKPAPDFLRMALALGAAQCIRKPFKPRDLLTMIETCLGPELAIAGGIEADQHPQYSVEAARH
ncbi:MAG: response regulator [Tardiphaga sp.]|jgi:CheY-like chemotaxis protein